MAVTGSKANYVAGQGVVRINTLKLILKPDPLDPGLGICLGVGLVGISLVLFKGLFLVIGKLLCIAQICFRGVIADEISHLILIIPEYRHQRGNGSIQIIILRRHDLL